MAKLTIIKGEDNPVLRAVSAKVKKFDGKLKKFARDLKQTMVGAKGIGIAAPQVGENIQVCIVVLNYDTPNQITLVMVNPEIIGFSKETFIAEEGCLSLPGQYGKVERSKAITVEFYDLEEEKYIFNLEGLNARVVQHEVDHLNGILFLDRMKKGEKEEDLLM